MIIHSAEYIWLDGAHPTQTLRSKTRFLGLASDRELTLDDLPTWSFDGSSTHQSGGADSDLLLLPVAFVRDPLRERGILVLCEVAESSGKPHESNRRARLRSVIEQIATDEDPWFGFEQEFTLYHSGRPLGFPDDGYPEPQGRYYCGVGAKEAHGRDLVEAHASACLSAGLMIYGTNAEVMPGQWEFQIGPRGLTDETAGPLEISDHLWIARWLLIRIAEERGIVVSFDPKPVAGDWNGAGAHTNFSTRSMRAPGGRAAIDLAIQRLAATHDADIAWYGAGLEERLTGLHETCSIDVFRSGVADRGSSVRVPRHVAATGSGYLEDRRPGANCDPYVVCARILASVCTFAVEAPERRAV